MNILKCNIFVYEFVLLLLVTQYPCVIDNPPFLNVALDLNSGKNMLMGLDSLNVLLSGVSALGVLLS